MRAAWYDRQGPASDVLTVGELPDPEPGPGEVRVRLHLSGINPGDTKKREGFFGSAMPFPRVVSHSDGAGVVDRVGAGVDPGRVGRRVWVFGAQSYRASGTAAAFSVVPADLATDLPDAVDDALGACLGIPGITAHRCVFADGPVSGATVVVQGVLGGVGAMAAALAANADLDDALLANHGVIAAYATDDARTTIPFWTLLFHNVTIRLCGSDDVPLEAKLRAAADLTALAAAGGLAVASAPPYPLGDIAAAHAAVEGGARRGRVLIDVTA